MISCEDELNAWRAMDTRDTGDAEYLMVTTKLIDTLLKDERYPEAIPVLERAIGVLSGKDEQRELPAMYNNLGIAHFMLGEYELGLKAHFEALRLAMELGDPIQVTRAHNGIGFVHRNNRNHDDALRSFMAAEESSRELTDHDPRVVALNEIANVYMMREDFDNSLEWRLKALELAQRSGLDRGVGFVTHDLALTYLMRREYDKALTLYTYILDNHRQHEDKRETAITLENIAAVQLELGQTEMAITQLREALELAESVQTRYEMLSINSLLADALSRQGLHDEAFSRLNEAMRLQRTLYDEDRDKAIAGLQARHNLQQKEREAEIYRLRNVELARANDLLTDANEQLRKHQEELVRLERKNSVLAMAVTANHEINQPLMILQGNLDLLREALPVDPAHERAVVQLRRMQESVERIGEILRKYRSNEAISLGEYEAGTPMVVFGEDEPKT